MKRVLGLFVVVGLLCGVSSAFAGETWKSYDEVGEGFYIGITKADKKDCRDYLNGGSTYQLTISDSETPFLHIHKDANSSVTFDSFWWAPEAGGFFQTGYLPSDKNDVWLTLSDWNAVKESGLWYVGGGAVTSATPGMSQGMVAFSSHVAPEPVSSTLFLLGGLGLLGGRVVRRKKA